MRWDLIVPAVILVVAAAGTLVLVEPAWPSVVAWWVYWTRKPPAPSTMRAYRTMGIICAGGVLAMAVYVTIHIFWN